MARYDVGTVLWIIHKDRPGLVAYRVIEEITKKTLDGEKVQYVVQPAKPKGKLVQLGMINGRIFLSSEEAKNALIENATKAIDSMVEKTQNLITKVFTSKDNDSETIDRPEETPIYQTQSLKEGHQWLTMEDGSKVQIKLPEILK